VQLSGGEKIADLKLPAVSHMQLTFSAHEASLLCVLQNSFEREVASGNEELSKRGAMGARQRVLGVGGNE